jgi:hypothetical protein
MHGRPQTPLILTAKHGSTSHLSPFVKGCHKKVPLCILHICLCIRTEDVEKGKERENVAEVYMKESRRGGGGGMTVKESLK